MYSRMYKMCVWGGVIDTLLDRLQDQFAAFMSEKGVDALIIEVCVVVARRLLCERQVGRDGGKERETARARMDARARAHTHTLTHTRATRHCLTQSRAKDTTSTCASSQV